MRLQSENPFDFFRKAVEKVASKNKKEQKSFGFDQEFFVEAEDKGMCLSMHQPWASLVVMGFKRFEGREWTAKYRGPLWIHATSQVPESDLIEAIEGSYEEFYNCVGEDRP
jgi:hypothetical protein